MATNPALAASVKAAVGDPAAGECVTVAVRCRPLSKTETRDGHASVVAVDRRSGQISVRNPNVDPSKRTVSATGEYVEEGPKTFSFDFVFDSSCSQETVYDETCRKIVDSVLEGYNGTIFAYGQTGTGKTFTMEGEDSPPQLRGVMWRAFEHVFSSISGMREDTNYLVQASFLEIYNDDIIDLLAPDPKARKKLELKENAEGAVYVKDLTKHVVGTVDDCRRLLAHGKALRKTSETAMNPGSSRSHCVFTVTVECSSVREDGQEHIRVGKLNMVDLAGSERQEKTQASGIRLLEATRINLSLTALGNVISALAKLRGKAAHIPYRDSKLTRLLQDSLGGNTRTVMIANVGPAGYNFDETISTLQFANRAKQIQNKPRINEDPKDAMLRQIQDEIKNLQKELESAGGGANAYLEPGVAVPSRRTVVERINVQVVKKPPTEDELNAKRLEEERQLTELNARLVQQRESALAAQREAEMRRQSLEAESQRLQQHLEQKRADRDQLLEKLAQVESKVVKGRRLLDKAAEQEQRLEESKLELQRQKIEAERVQRILKQREEKNMNLASQYESLDKQLEATDRGLARLRQNYAEAKREVEQLQLAQQREREEMMDSVRELRRALLLRDAMISAFVPTEQRAKLEARAVWSADREDWALAPLRPQDITVLPRPQSAAGPAPPFFAPRSPSRRALPIELDHMPLPSDGPLNRPSASVPGQPDPLEQQPSRLRPVSAFVRRCIALGGTTKNYRFRPADVLTLELDLPARTTKDWDEVVPANAGAMAMPADDYGYGNDDVSESGYGPGPAPGPGQGGYYHAPPGSGGWHEAYGRREEPTDDRRFSGYRY